MTNLVYIYALPFTLLLLVFFLTHLDHRKKRDQLTKPFISFIMPCYNDSGDLEESVKSVYQSYDNFELFIINDKSTDNSLEILKRLNKEYGFNLVNNDTNLGKTASINNVVPKTRGEIIFGIDADVVLTKKCIADILQRFNFDPRIAIISCPYKPKNYGFFPRMQDIEYNQIKTLKAAQNNFSVLGAWGVV